MKGMNLLRLPLSVIINLLEIPSVWERTLYPYEESRFYCLFKLERFVFNRPLTYVNTI